MKKKILFLASLLFISIGANVNIFASGYPVIDVTKVLAMINSTLTLIDQWEANIQNVQNTFRQLEATKKQFEAYDTSEFWQGDNFRDRFRNSLRSVTNYANRMTNLTGRMENLINTPNIRVGNTSISLADLRNPQNVAGLVTESIGYAIVDPFRMTERDKMNFYSQFGLNPVNFMRLKTIKDMGLETAKLAIAREMMDEIFTEEEQEALVSIAEGGLTADSIMKVDQAKIQLAKATIDAINNVEHGILLQNKFWGEFIEGIESQRALNASARVGNQIVIEREFERILERQRNGIVRAVTETVDQAPKLVEVTEEDRRRYHSGTDFLVYLKNRGRR